MPGRGEDETLVWYEGSNLSTPSWLYTDQQGSLVNVANSAGSGGAPYRYSPSGEPEGGWGSGPAIPIFRYTGQAALPQIGLYYYKARMYDPGLGRFLQTDPIGYKDDWNLYAYVGNDPANRVDPSGLMPGDLFDTMDEAAFDAIQSMNPRSIAENREYAGPLFQDGGKWVASVADRGTGDKVQFTFRGKLRGDWHTHGDYSRAGKDGRPTRSSKNSDDFDSDNFSRNDKEGSRNRMRRLNDPNYRSYLGTPSGEAKKFDPSKGEQSTMQAPFGSPSESRFKYLQQMPPSIPPVCTLDASGTCQ